MTLADKPGPGEKGYLFDLLENTDFHIVFKVDAADARVKAKTVSSEDCKSKKSNSSDEHPLTTVTLASVRSLGNLSPRYYFRFPNDENIVPEKTTIVSYLFSIKENVTELQNADKEKRTAVLAVHCRSRSATRTRRIELPKSKSPDPKANLRKLLPSSEISDKDDPLPEPTPIPKADTDGMLADIFDLDYEHPADMTGDDWNLVMLTNSLLNGLIFDPKTKTMQVAREPAFQLKRSYPDAFKMPAGSTSYSTLSLIKEGDDNDKPDSVFSVPAFRVTDDSSVKITIVKNSLQKSMAQQSFSSWDVEASLSAGFGKFSGEVSGSYGELSAQFSKAVSESGQECMHASYDFPRAKVVLDAYDLELSESCKKFCQIRPFDIDGFYARFGIAFSCSNLLGARLQSFSDATLFAQKDDYENEEQKKAGFAASFSTPWASGSASSSYEHRTKTDKQGKQTNISMSLQWEAQGGETYLSTNPAAWIRTVAPYHSWRIIQRDDVRNILDIVDSISPNLLYSATKFEVFDISIKMTWVFANSGYFLKADFLNLPIVLGPDSKTPVETLAAEAQWIVEYIYDKEWITIANFGWRLDVSPNEKTLRYITPEEIANGSSVQLSEQPYRWRIERDTDSSSIAIFLPANPNLENSKDLYLTGVNGSVLQIRQSSASETVIKPSIQLQPLDKVNPKYNQQWKIGQGSKKMPPGGWENERAVKYTW